jgi:hypothetical protein
MAGEHVAYLPHALPHLTRHCIQAFDAMIHFSFEGSFLFLSTFGRQVNTSTGPFAEMCTKVEPFTPHALY